MARTDSVSSSPLPTISTVPSAPSTISQEGKDGDFTTQAAIGSLSARPTNDIVNRKAFYDVVFLTATTGTIKKIEVTFPPGTSNHLVLVLMRRRNACQAVTVPY